MMTQFSDDYIDGLLQDCSNSSATALELQQSFNKPLIYLPVIHLWDQCGLVYMSERPHEICALTAK